MKRRALTLFLLLFFSCLYATAQTNSEEVKSFSRPPNIGTWESDVYTYALTEDGRYIWIYRDSGNPYIPPINLAEAVGRMFNAIGMLRITKVVNSNMPHAIQRSVERGVFTSKESAREALNALGKSISKNGIPSNAIKDTAHADRILVPIGNKGLAVYQVAKNGTAKLKTVLNAN